MRQAITRITLFVVASFASVPVAAFDDPHWPTYQGDSGHSGFIDRDLMLFKQAPAWSVTPQEYPVDGLAIGAGIVFVTPQSYFGADPALIALDLADGAELWRKTFPDVYSINPPAYDATHGRVYLQTGNHDSNTFLRAYAAVDGTFAWESPFGAQWERYLAPTVIAGQVYINGGHSGGAYGFAASDGAESWFASLPQYDRWTPTQYGSDKLLAWTDGLTILDRATGAVLDTIIDPDFDSTGWTAGQTPAVVGNRAFVTNGGRLIAFDLDIGEVAWAVDIGAFGQVSTDGVELAVVLGDRLTLRDPADGALIWEWQPPTASMGPHVLMFRNHILVRSLESTYIVDRRTHQAVRTIPVDGVIAYADDHLVIGGTGDSYAPRLVTAIYLPSTPLMRSGFE